MQQFGEHFVEARRRGRSTAWRKMLDEMMLNLHVLVPDCVGFDRAFATAMEIEKFLKDNPEQATDEASPMQLISDFLNSSPTPTTPSPTAEA